MDKHFHFVLVQMIKNLPAMQETWVHSLDQEDPPGEGHGNPVQYSCLGSVMDRGAWRATAVGLHRVPITTEQLTLFLFRHQKTTEINEIEYKSCPLAAFSRT